MVGDGSPVAGRRVAAWMDPRPGRRRRGGAALRSRKVSLDYAGTPRGTAGAQWVVFPRNGG